ncbi:FAD-dependent oxidoreductase [Veronia nyctiphanis]|uniref:FAD-dependent oxidoreductase n=1 Tax=Veronia nyctiphanis TaxID=1278244 RepID=A0A4Q0YUU7_9GAMM|nr:FAD-dependent oxidoreductase [Veronia nyctiphanis]RXJ74593.1 FAD-dependent oxidoreductase [Veronia nyctiphanis]
MKIAIIGSGISGLTCAHYLHKEHDITVFEANDYVGGHTATIDVEVESGQYAIDTGFIVYNDRTYPRFQKLLAELGIEGLPTEMSFSVHNAENGLEYNGHTVFSLFAQKRNIFNPKFYLFIREILRFNKLAKDAYQQTDALNKSEHTLGDFLEANGFSDYFCENYILPMGAAIWSSTLSDMRGFPLSFFVRFFFNHGLLDIANRPQWYVIPGGSREYVRKMIPAFESRIRLNTPVQTVKRDQSGVTLVTEKESERFDQVIFACHSNQALKLLDSPSKDESTILGALEYQSNEVVLHTDTSMLPKRKAAWASWNYYLGMSEDRDNKLASLTYDMNILQQLNSTETFCVTLNQTQDIDPDKVLRSFNYEHPVFNGAAIAAQKHKSKVSGLNNTWFCGAYWYNGFHEDGVRSATDVIEGIQNIEQPLRFVS